MDHSTFPKDLPSPGQMIREALREKDPNGMDPHQPGAKLDDGKAMMSLVMLDMNLALKQVAEVATYGAKKYTKGGWKTVPNGFERYTDAMLRHLLSEPNEMFDQDTGIEHAAHAAWNALARLQLLLSMQRRPQAVANDTVNQEVKGYAQ